MSQMIVFILNWKQERFRLNMGTDKELIKVKWLESKVLKRVTGESVLRSLLLLIYINYQDRETSCRIAKCTDDLQLKQSSKWKAKELNYNSPWKMVYILNGKQNLRMINIKYKAFPVFPYKSTSSLLVNTIIQTSGNPSEPVQIIEKLRE